MSRKLTYDSWLFGSAMLILVVGMVMIYSASAIIATQRFGHGPYYFLARQVAFLAGGAIAMVVLMHMNPALLQDKRVVYGSLAAVGLALIPIGGYFALSAAYRRERLLTFLNPEADSQGAGFQALQSLIALGTGGVRGLGIGNGRQKLFFLPEPHTDFIFSIIGEELGFVGAIMLVGAFAFLVWRAFRVVRYSQDRFAFYAALGCTLMIAIQALINVSVALCLLPTKGLPLPLVSYGGSSLIASLIAVGLLLNFSQQAS